MSNTGLRSLPDGIGKLASLERLDLSGSRALEGLPESIDGELSNLKDLNLSFTGIRTLPDWIGNLESLEFLYLSFSRLESLPPSIENLNNLRIIDVRRVNLSNDSWHVLKRMSRRQPLTIHR